MSGDVISSRARQFSRCVILVLAAISLLFHNANAQGTLLKKGSRLAIVGDSITAQKMYSRIIETYLTVCAPELDVKVMQFGQNGEQAAGFLNRMNNDLDMFKPTVVTLCYGMNDGGYKPYEETTGKAYETQLREIVAKLRAKGMIVVIGSPGAVDTMTWRGGGDAPKTYNTTLAALGDIAKKTAEETRMAFADLHDLMIETMTQAKAALGDAYDVCGFDGIHPNMNGHLVMAYAFLKALGLPGEIGHITIDLKGSATASSGHRVIKAENGAVEIESTRYPFCFFGDGKSSSSTKSILPFLPFNQSLNRFVLVVKNLDSEKATVTWGKDKKSFSRSELEAGINLAAEFLDNPFVEAFQKVDSAVYEKESFETFMVESALGEIRAKLSAEQEKLSADVRAAVVLVKHTIVVK